MALIDSSRETLNVLVIGSGGREHVLAWKLSQSPSVKTLYVAPGNAGTAIEDKVQNVPLDPMDFESLAQLIEEKNIELTVVGPEQPLVAGLVDYLASKGIFCFGPTQAAAQLEGSKSFAKEFMRRHQIPTADYKDFTEVDKALEYLQQCQLPIVIKADGLAAGKGVIVATALEEAQQAVCDMLSGSAFGVAGQRLVIEEFIEGEEASFIAMVDGRSVLPMATSQDHKRIGDADTGPNTGGMGAYSPAPLITPSLYQRIMEEIVEPTVKGMAQEGNSYRGFLYVGLMIDKEGNPNVIEFNCRFGDPEAQPIMMRLQSDFVDLCLKVRSESLDTAKAEWDARPALGVVMATAGYPQSYRIDEVITGLEQPLNGCKVFHAGTKQANDQLVTAGGRVLCVTALGETIRQAQHRAYEQVSRINWDSCYYRTDIGNKAINRSNDSE